MKNTSAGRMNDAGRHSFLIENANPMSASGLVDLHALADKLRAESDVAVLDRKELNVSRGAGETLTIVTLVVKMSNERAERLRQEFGGSLVVERDLGLTHLDASPEEAGGSQAMAQQRRRGEAGRTRPPEEDARDSTTGPEGGGGPEAVDASEHRQREEPEGEGGGPAQGKEMQIMERAVEKRKAQFLIFSPVRPGQLRLSGDVIADNLKRIADVEVVATVPPPSSIVTAFGAGMPGTESIVVARMTPERANVLQQAAGGQLHVEEDSFLTYGELSPRRFRTLAVQNPGVAVSMATGFTATITVTGDGKPLAQAEVYLYGHSWPARGTTDANGRVTLTVVGDSADSLTGLLVQPKADYWSYWLDRPLIASGENTVVSLESLAKTFSNFPDQELVGWGLKAMNIDQLPPTYRGRGVKIAIIDSGAAVSHRDLQQIRLGFDAINGNDQSWNEDLLGHGSHCAGVISGLHNSVGIRGIAPDAEIHICRIFPGGQYSHLISALNYCIEHEIDVVNLSLGSPAVSTIVAQRIALAKEAGVACIVAAGNSSGEVQFPANLQDALAVAAIGRRGTFPEGSYHNQQIHMPEAHGSADGYFSAEFTCFGPQIDVAAPGVAVISSIPPDNFVAMDGTSMAAPHVTGLAALVLAHHRDFTEGPFQARNAARVMRLWDILKRSCHPLNLGDPQRTGAGLPDALVALGLQPATTAAVTLPDQQAFQQWVQQWAAGLLAGAGASQQGIALPSNFAPVTGYPSMMQLSGAAPAIAIGPARTWAGS